MSTLLLTSGGLRFAPVAAEFLKLIGNKPKEIKFAHIMTASKMAKDKSYLEQDIAAIKNLGIPYQDVDIEGKSEEELRDILKDFDVIYVQGGTPYYLLKHVKLSGFDTVVKELINQGKLYVGVSAGSFIACPTIEQALWKKPQRDRYGLPDDEPALRLVPFLIAVHYQDKDKEAVKAGIAHTRYPVRILTNNQALLVRDGQVELVGSGEEITIPMVNTTTDSVRIVLFDESDTTKFLVLSEKDDPENSKLPGGKFNSIIESPSAAAKREIMEELGVSPDQIHLREASVLVNDDGVSKRYIYWGTCNKNLLTPSDEVDHVEWVTEENIPAGKNHEHMRSALKACQRA